MTDDKQNKPLIDKNKQGAEKWTSAAEVLIHTGALYAGETIREFKGEHDKALEMRAVRRAVWQEKNINAVARKAEKYMAPASDEEKREKAAKMAKENPDFVANCLDGCKNVSDETVQDCWAKLLAGETDNPGTFSKKTLSVLRDMDKKDVRLFEEFCQFVVYVGWGESKIINSYCGSPNFSRSVGNELLLKGRKCPLLYNIADSIFPENYFPIILDLDSMGLVSAKVTNSAHQTSDTFLVFYHGVVIFIQLPLINNFHRIAIGEVGLTRAGKELFALCKPKENKNFLRYLMEEWKKRGYNPIVYE